ncbi:MAG TPA: S9 family peptidase, partial [Allosphingosinicella sp.]
MNSKTVLLAACAGLTAAAVPALARSDAPLIPREKIFGNPTKVSGRLSPDGKWLSWIAPREGVLNIYVAPADNPGAARALTSETKRPLRQYSWSPDSRHILFINDKGGDENFLLYGVDVTSGEQRTLTPFEKTRVRIINISNEVHDRILVGVNNRDPKWHDVHSLDLKSGKLTPVLSNTGGYANFLADEQLNIRIAAKSRPDGGTDFHRVSNNVVDAQPFEQVTLEDSQTTQPIGFTADGKTLYWLDSRGRDTAAAIAQDVATGRKTVVAQNAKADIGGAMANPRTGRLEAYAVNYLKNEWIPLGGAVKGDLDFLKSRLKGEFTVNSRTEADDKWIVGVDPVTAPSSAHLYDRKAKTLTKLYTTRPELEGVPLAAMHPVEIKTRDGLTMVSYLTLPVGADPDGDGKPDKAVPLVLMV